MSDYAVLTAIKAPFTVIQENGVDYVDVISTEAVDPAKVTRCAVENAASIALTILGTEGVVLPRELWS
jgi:chaperonin GroEL (HSP60 family)